MLFSRKLKEPRCYIHKLHTRIFYVKYVYNENNNVTDCYNKIELN